MTVQDYAESMNYTVQDVLNKCKELGIKVNQKDDLLDDDAIVMLDNTMFSLDEEDDLVQQGAEDNAIPELHHTALSQALFDILPNLIKSNFNIRMSIYEIF